MPGAESWPGPGRAVVHQGDKRCPVVSLTSENLNSEVPPHYRLKKVLHPEDSHILNIWSLLSLWLLLASNPACIFRDLPAPSPLLPPCDPGAVQLGSVLPPRILGIWRCVRVGEVVYRELNIGKSFLSTLSRTGVHALYPSAWTVAMGTSVSEAPACQ